MANKEIQTYFEMASLQIAAEAFLVDRATTAELKTSLEAGNMANSKLPTTQNASFGIGDPERRFHLIAHQDLSLRTPEPEGAETGLESGFSASLFYDNKKKEYTISFRSTEFAENIRDAGDIETNLEIAEFGWAFSQLHSMDAFWGFVKNGEPLVTAGLNVPVSSALDDFRDYLDADKKVSVTGYSLGANLATAFTELHSESVSNTYLFNGAGTGKTVVPGGLRSVWALYQSVFNGSTESPVTLEGLLGISGYSLAAAEVLAPGQLSFESSIALNTDHWRALIAISDYVQGSAFVGPVFDEPLRLTQGFSGLITDIWADDTTNPSALENGVAATGVRHGKATPIWYEEQPDFEFGLFGDSWFDFGAGHSIASLYDSLAVMAAFEKIDPAVTKELLGEIFDVSSHQEHQSLESVVNALARVFGEAPIDEMHIAGSHRDFANIDQRNALHTAITAIQDSALFQLFVDEGEDTGELTAKAVLKSAESASAVQNAKNNFGQFLALQQLTPFVIQEMDASVEQALKDAHSTIAADWISDQGLSDEERAQGLANYSDQFYADRTLILATLLGRNRENESHGDLYRVQRFTDLENSISLNADSLPEGVLRANLAFGTYQDDVNTLSSSILNDQLYGMGGDDTISGQAGLDYIEGGAGNDTLNGEEGADRLFGGYGDDHIHGGEGDDTLHGGLGNDTFYWNPGDGSDTIIDGDSGSDRIVVDGVDLADIDFFQTSEFSGVYRAASHPDIELIRNGSGLLIQIDNAIADLAGSIHVTNYASGTNQNIGIELTDNAIVDLPSTNYDVLALGSSASQTIYDAYGRETFDSSGQDWSITSIRFNADDVSNFSGVVGGSAFSVYADYFEGGNLADNITGDDGANVFSGNAGDDLIDSAGGEDRIYGGGGSDVLIGGDGEDYIWGGALVGREYLEYSGYYLPFVYDKVGDTNTIVGGAGTDRLSGGRHSDHINGGTENDFLWGGTGADIIEGGENHDTIYGDSNMEWRLFEQDDQLLVRKQNAWAEGIDVDYEYSDILSGGDGDDTLWGEQGDDTLFGGSGDDLLHGDRSAHMFYEEDWGGTTSALENQFHGNDFLYGGAGTDFLWGNAGDDFLSGGTGTDVLDGGVGDDVYHYSRGDDFNIVTDEAGEHTFLFTDVSAADLVIKHVPDPNIPGQKWVLVGVSGSSGGIQIAKSQWDNVKIAVGTADALIERSSIDTRYFSQYSGEVAAIDGVYGITEAQRDALFEINDDSGNVPQFNLSADIEEGVVRPIESVGSSKVQLTFSTSAFGPMFDFDIVISESLLDNVTLDGDTGLSYVGFAGDIDGTDGDDRVVGSEGQDAIVAGTGNDVLVGAGGADFLDGGLGFDTYVFSSGDGTDTVSDIFGDTRLEFEDVNPADLALYFADNTHSNFRIEYSPTDYFTTEDGIDIDRITDVLIDGQPAPLIIRSDLVNAVLTGTSGDNVFEAGSGSDHILADGSGNDVYKFASGDGSDLISLGFALGAVRGPMGEVRFQDASSADALSFDYSNSRINIGYGAGDQITVEQNWVRDSFDNALLYVSLTSEASFDWMPEIQSNPIGNTYGSFGSDRIMANDSFSFIVPSYGDDVIEGGDGEDTVYLDRLYFDKSYGGIGHKDIRGGKGADIVYTPLAQGLTFRFGLGDGQDTISYNWSTTYDYELSGTGVAPYDITIASPTELSFTAYGDDRIVFDDGIALSDLSYVRFGDNLQISINGGADRIRIENFFVTNPVSEAPNFGEVDADGPVVSSLEVLYARGELPENPLREIVVEGQAYDLPTLLEDNLEVLDGPPPTLFLGTDEFDEVYYEDEGDFEIYTFGDYDDIEIYGGTHYIDSGSGDDYLYLAADTTVFARSGDDTVYIESGENTVDLGAGDDLFEVDGGVNTVTLGGGSDTVYTYGGDNTIVFGAGEYPDEANLAFISADAGIARVIVAENLSLNDIAIERANLGNSAPGFDYDALKLTVTATGESLYLTGTTGGSLHSPPTSFVQGPAITELTFFDNVTIAGAQLWEIAGAAPGGFLQGTAANDLLVGTIGNDILSADAGEDVVYGLGGNDIICGGDQADIIDPGTGNDIVFGGKGDDVFLVDGTGIETDYFNGGDGYDTILGSSGPDTLRFNSLHASDSIEEIDLKLDFASYNFANQLHGTAGDNHLDFSNVILRNVFLINAGDGDDVIYGTDAGVDLIVGGYGNDEIHSGSGNDVYVFANGSGIDTYYHNDLDSNGADYLALLWMDHDNIWLTQENDDLVLDLIGTSDRAIFKDWYVGQQHKLGEIRDASVAASAAGIETLVEAMAMFDVSTGQGEVIPGHVADALAPTMASVWQPL